MSKEARRVVDRRRRRSREQKVALVERWCESGLSRAEFCRQEGICYGSFSGWITRWMAEEERAEQAPEFVEVLGAVADAGQSDQESGGIELLAPNGWLVRMRGGFEIRDLERVVEVLGRC